MDAKIEDSIKTYTSSMAIEINELIERHPTPWEVYIDPITRECSLKDKHGAKIWLNSSTAGSFCQLVNYYSDIQQLAKMLVAEAEKERNDAENHS